MIARNTVLLVASYVFYGWWDWRFLFLILISTCADYTFGILIDGTNEKRKKKLFLWLSIILNLGVLGFFKYCNFFIDSTAELLSGMGFQPNISSLEIINPVGISFYTFQTLSYTIDVYRGNMKPTKNFIAFAAFISFFPQLVAGPIERATNLLPQFFKNAKFDVELAKDGLKQALWGFFKKIVIADHCAIYVNEIFGTKEVPVDFAEIPGMALIA
ncbi:MAG: MBOAT family protein, partial [Flavobacteriales bacterium]|nr:MBOAT family protein [Flavobacteriales bacterium]